MVNDEIPMAVLYTIGSFDVFCMLSVIRLYAESQIHCPLIPARRKGDCPLLLALDTRR